MGCASSISGSSMSSVAKHPADMYVPSLELGRTKIEKFDEFFTSFEGPANKVIGFSNTLASGILDIKLAAGALLGGFHVQLSAGSDHDSVLLELAKADGSIPPSDEVALLQKKPEVKAADAALAAALTALLATTPTGLAAAPDGVAGKAEFNDALKAFKAAVGAGYSVKVVLKPAAAAGAPTVVAVLSKPVFAGDAEVPTYQAASLLDIGASKGAKDVYAAQVGLAEQVHALAKVSKDLSISYVVKKGKVQTPEGIEDAAKLGAIVKAVATYNVQSYKLVHAGLTAVGDVNLATSIIAIVEALIKKAQKLAVDAGKDALSAIPTVTPVLTPKEDGSFDFKMDVKFNPDIVPDMPDFPECLPGPAKYIWKMIMALKDSITALFGEFPSLKDEITALQEKSQAVFAEVTETIKNAELPFADAIKVPSTVTANMTMTASIVGLIAAFAALAKVVVDDLQASVKEVEVKIEQAKSLAASLTA